MTNFLTVVDAKQEGVIPESFFAYIPDLCPCCGQDMWISESRTILKCSNDFCIRRIAFRADALLKDLGIKGYGPVLLENYCESINASSIIDFIQYPPMPYNVIELIQQRNPTYSQLVEMLHIPNFGTKAYKLFDGFDNFSDFLKAISKSDNASDFIKQRVGGDETANLVAQIIITYEHELREISKLIVVRPKAKRTILLQITGHILNVRSEDGRALTKDDYVYILNSIGREVGCEFRRSDALQSVSFIVADTASNTRKYRVGLERGILVSSDRLLESIKKLTEAENG